ncbi:ArsR/SmtB family transcription factor [Dermatophilus congolensis]|nr:winged helix-turn-helix domain-containing protein [Dermatophilus congolensis]
MTTPTDPTDNDHPLPHPAELDQISLRTLAHPMRSRILAELRSIGRATSADLAKALDTSTGVTSYHLRALANAGLITTSELSGRRRYWSLTTENRIIDTSEEDPADEASAEWLARDYAAYFGTKVQNWISHTSQWPPTWQELCGLEDRLVLVTDTQLAALQEEIAAILERYRRVGAGNPTAKRVTFYTCALPVDAPPRL